VRGRDGLRLTIGHTALISLVRRLDKVLGVLIVSVRMAFLDAGLSKRLTRLTSPSTLVLIVDMLVVIGARESQAM